MKKNSLLLITFLTLNAVDAATSFETSCDLPGFATDVKQSNVLTFSFSTTHGDSLCTAVTIVYTTHLDVIFHTLADGVKKGWGKETEILEQLRSLINEVRPDLSIKPIKDITYRH